MSTSPISVITYFELPDLLPPDSEYYNKEQAYWRFDLDSRRQQEESINREVAKRVKELEETIKKEKEKTIEVAMILVSYANAK